jgi:hypothetical protein
MRHARIPVVEYDRPSQIKDTITIVCGPTAPDPIDTVIVLEIGAEGQLN